MKNARKILGTIFLLLSGLLGVHGQQAPAPDKKNAVLVSGGGLVLQKGYAPTYVAEFHPTANVLYHRMLCGNFGIGVGYEYNEFDPICCFVLCGSRTYSTKFDCLQQNHSCMIAPDYSFDFHHFSFIPYVAMGMNWSKFTFDNNNNRTDRQTCFILSPGIRTGYNMGSWMVFASYHFDYYFISNFNYPYVTTMDGNVVLNKGHHSLNLGVGYNF